MFFAPSIVSFSHGFRGSLGGDFLVKIVTSSGKEEKFDSKDIKRDLEASGLPERVAEELSERVEYRVQDRWTSNQVWQEVNVEMKRLEGEMERAQKNLNSRSGMQTQNTIRQETTNADRSRTETFIPESERERHKENRY